MSEGPDDSDRFDEICRSVVSNINEDREELREALSKISPDSDMPELIPMMLDIKIKGYDALTRMNQQLLNVANAVGKRRPKTDEDKDIFAEIGDHYGGNH